MGLIRKLEGKEPVFGDNCWLAETAVVIGEVTMGKECTVWYNAVVRGDVHYIKMGSRVNVQDGAIIHCTYQKNPTEIGNDVSIGHNAIVHGCKIEDNVLIGMGAIVMDKVVVGSGSIIGAGSIVLEGTIIEPNSIYVGNPARKVKEVGEKGKAILARTPGNYVKYAQWFKDTE